MSPVLLASGSAARQAMLRAAGVPFAVRVPTIDETALRNLLEQQGATTDRAALALADAKAAAIAATAPQAIVLGADQMLDHDGRWLEKPVDLAAARAQLASLRGAGHRLVSAVVAWRGGARVWQAVDSADLEMRPFSDVFLDDYLETVGAAVLASVGAYQLEGRGAQLFSAIRGDFFTILGLPLVPLLEFLRREGVLMS